MNFNDLKIYKNVYEKRPINNAAKGLSYAQSNLTAEIKAMETEVRG